MAHLTGLDNLKTSTASALANNAINGGSLEEALEGEGALAMASDSAQTSHADRGGVSYFTLDASGQQTSLARTELNAGKIEIKSGGDTTLSAIEANAQSLDIQTGGKLKLNTASTVEESAQHITHGSTASVGAKGQGSKDETLHYNQFNVGNLTIDAKGGIQAQVSQHVNLNELAQQPGMGWVEQIVNDPTLAGSTEWQRVQEAHEQWQYRQTGMGPVSAALVAVMVAAAAAPAASAAGSAAGGATFGAGGSIQTALVVKGAVQAGVLALSNQVGVSFFNNHGNLGAVFDELGSSQSVKNLATAIVTGGVLAGMGFNPIGTPEVAGAKKEFFDLLLDNLKTNTASALVSNAINGGSLEEALKGALTNALLNTVAANGANYIGDLSVAGGPLNTFTNKLAHMLAGCALGTAKADSSGGCAAGAIGASVGEFMAEAMGRTDDTVYMAGLFGGLAAALAGGDSAAVAIGNWAGSNAAANNYLNHDRPSLLGLSEQERYDNAVMACAGGDAAACTTKTELAQLSANRALTLNEACAGGASTAQCQAETAQAIGYGNTVVRDANGNTFATSDYPNGFPTAGPVRSPMEGTFAGEIAQSTATGLALTSVGVTAAGAADVIAAGGAACVANPMLCAQASGIGGAIAGGADALGQWFQTGNIRPGQTVMATFNGGIGVPLGMSTGMLGNIAVGAYGGVANAAFQNIYYGDSNSLPGAGLIGGVFGATGAGASTFLSSTAINFFPAYKPRMPALFQQPSPIAPLVGVGGGSIVQGVSSFIPPPQGPKR